jgi:hypothetical protein
MVASCQSGELSWCRVERWRVVRCRVVSWRVERWRIVWASICLCNDDIRLQPSPMPRLKRRATSMERPRNTAGSGIQSCCFTSGLKLFLKRSLAIVWFSFHSRNKRKAIYFTTDSKLFAVNSKQPSKSEPAYRQLSHNTQCQLIVYKNKVAKMDYTVCIPSCYPFLLYLLKWWRHQFPIGLGSIV